MKLKLKRIFFVFGMLLAVTSQNALWAQVNLVPNPSFEDTIKCPSSMTNLGDTKLWFSPSNGSPDYYNNCSIGNGYSSPFGHKTPRSLNGYTGVYVFINNNSNSREYLSIPLIKPLKEFQKYCINYYVSLSIRSDFAIHHFGGLLQSKIKYQSNVMTLNVTKKKFFIDSSANYRYNWSLVSGLIMTDTQCLFLTIGNFQFDNEIDTVLLNENQFGFTYYYIDDVSLYQMDDSAAGVDVAACVGERILLGKPKQDYYRYQWFPAEGLSCTTCAQPLAAPTQTTQYVLQLTDSAQGSRCVLFDTVTVTVDPTCSKPSLGAPNVFTPNGDGINDVLLLTATALRQVEVRLFNRWGQALTSNTYTNIAYQQIPIWDGTHQNQPTPDGTYYLVAEGLDFNNKPISYRGVVTLVR